LNQKVYFVDINNRSHVSQFLALSLVLEKLFLHYQQNEDFE